MAKPVLTDTGERFWEALKSLFWTDEAHGWAGAKFLSALAKMFDPAAEVVQPHEAKPPFAILLDPDLCPEVWLPWLCQFVGIDTALGQALVTQKKASVLREWIKGPINLQRGSFKAMREAAQLTLTGTKTVFLYTRYNGEAFRTKAATLTSETPRPKETLEAIESMMAGWMVLTYETVSGGTVAILEASHAKLSEVEAAHATDEDLELHPEK